MMSNQHIDYEYLLENPKKIFLKLFDFNDIIVNVKLNNNDYVIESIQYDFKKSITKKANIDIIKKNIDNMNENFVKSSNFEEIRLFETLKSLFTLINENTPNHETYFRGQRDDWIIRPNIFRGDIDKDFIRDYESIYYELSTLFPDEIDYVDIKNIKDKNDNTSYIKRANQLALLQHYGFRTTLIDITSNPFVAMLFMCATQVSSLRNGVIDIFLIDKEKDKNFNSIFIKTNQSKNNKRLKAQSGAFFCYDKVLQLAFKDIEPINSIRIKLNFKYDTPKILNDSKKTPIATLEYFESMEKKLNTFISESKKNLTEGNYDDKKITEKDMKLVEKYKLNLQVGESYDKLFTIIKNNYDEQRMNVFLSEKENFIKGIEKIRVELLNTLKEYYYLEEKLYPDLYNQTNFIIKKYLSNSRKSI